MLALLLVVGLGYFALNPPAQLADVAWPWQVQNAPSTSPSADSSGPTIRTDPLGRVTDAAIQAAVDQQPISIAALRSGEYTGSPLTVVRNLPAGSNYTRQVVSYQSDGLKIYALLTVPRGQAPQGGWPAIVFNHGYIPPAEYRTTERYVAYQDAFARAGFVTLKSDYRGHGQSEGVAAGGYNDAGYTIDVLNAAASLKKDARVNAGRLGMWGHSMGGQLSLRAMLVDPDIRAASLWAGVVAGYDVLSTDWHRAGEQGESTQPAPTLGDLNRRYLRLLSHNAHLQDLRGRPLQLHHGTADKDVPYSFQVALAQDLRAYAPRNRLLRLTATKETTTTSAAICGWPLTARWPFLRSICSTDDALLLHPANLFTYWSAGAVFGGFGGVPQKDKAAQFGCAEFLRGQWANHGYAADPFAG